MLEGQYQILKKKYKALEKSKGGGDYKEDGDGDDVGGSRAAAVPSAGTSRSR